MVFGTFQKDFSQVATSQMCNFPNGNFPKVRFLGPLRHRRVQLGLSAAARMGYWGRALGLEQAGGRLPRLGQTWEVTAVIVLYRKYNTIQYNTIQ